MFYSISNAHALLMPSCILKLESVYQIASKNPPEL